MTEETFQKHLIEASDFIVEATREYVDDVLPDEFRFLVVPNSSFDGNPLEDDEEIFPKESIPEWTTKPPMDACSVINDLYRNGKVPEWINVYVDSSDNEYTYLLLECCGRFTAMEKHLYHAGKGVPPFSTKIEMPSLDYELESHGKFQLRSRYYKSEPIARPNSDSADAPAE
ncbi:MAG: hypothetical protein COA78_34305 [Blastopirellula sp.]|nr:MAG: hypothetical protein COA78_34305 [Blastopirellula sp.]